MAHARPRAENQRRRESQQNGDRRAGVAPHDIVFVVLVDDVSMRARASTPTIVRKPDALPRSAPLAGLRVKQKKEEERATQPTRAHLQNDNRRCPARGRDARRWIEQLDDDDGRRQQRRRKKLQSRAGRARHSTTTTKNWFARAARALNLQDVGVALDVAVAELWRRRATSLSKHAQRRSKADRNLAREAQREQRDDNARQRRHAAAPPQRRRRQRRSAECAAH